MKLNEKEKNLKKKFKTVSYAYKRNVVQIQIVMYYYWAAY